MIPRFVAALAVVALGLSLTCADEAKPAPAKPDPAALAKLVAQLGGERFEDREAACEALDAFGPLALDALRKALISSDPEIHRRVLDLVERIEKRVESAELTQPKLVRLVYNDMPIAQAVQDIARKTGFMIQLDGDQTKVANRKITLDTGDVSFWQAVDQFCEKAGLVERGSMAIADNASPPAGSGEYASRVEYLGGVRGARSEMPLALLDGKPQAMPTYYGGAVRVRILPRAGQTGGAPKNPDGKTLLTVEISPEPKLGLRSILSVRIDRVLDERGNELKAPLPYICDSDEIIDLDGRLGVVNTNYVDGMGQRNDLSMRVPLRFPLPEGVKKLNEIHGSVAAEVLTAPAPLITMDNVLDAAGKTAEGKNGGSLKVLEVKRDDKGQVTLKITVDKPPMPQARGGGFGGRVRMVRRGGMMVEEQPNAVGAAGRILSLVDEKGQAFKLTAADQKLDEQNLAIVEYQLTFQPTDGPAMPTKLVYLGRRKTTIDVPFVLKDVPVP
ncbi:MAG TPA: hypothetical protein VGG61_13525, partial [Gemmataceae bacterium]